MYTRPCPAECGTPSCSLTAGAPTPGGRAVALVRRGAGRREALGRAGRVLPPLGELEKTPATKAAGDDAAGQMRSGRRGAGPRTSERRRGGGRGRAARNPDATADRCAFPEVA